jgi:iron(III) transport system permease protein
MRPPPKPADMVDQDSQVLSGGNGRRRWRRPDGWSLWALLVSAVVLAPIVAVVWIAAHPVEPIWDHLRSTVLPGYIKNSLLLMALVGVGTGLIGTGGAWLVVMYDFPGKRWLQWALLAPLALPGYVAAYALVDFLEYAGPVQTGLRALFGWQSAQDYWFFEIRSLWSAAFVLTLALYPYVYLLTRAALREQSASLTEVARALGCSPRAVFWRVALPLARPAIAAGMAIAMMETLADYGTVNFFAVQTLTTGIFSTWLQGYNAGGAAQIACVILVLVLVLAGAEKFSRRQRRYHALSSRRAPHMPVMLHGTRAFMAMLACFAPFALGFILPIAVLANQGIAHFGAWADAALWRAVLHTVILGGVTALVTLGAALVLVYGVRLSNRRLPRLLLPVATIGYAAPGAVLAIGVLFPLATLDIWLAEGLEAIFGGRFGLLMTGSIAALVLAYSVRFFAIGQGAVDSALGRVTPSMDMAARSLGRNAGQVLGSVHLPLIRGSVQVGALLIFVDVVKELPATLILRPFNFETLATHVYNQASLENLPQGAPAALLIVLVGLLPLALIARQERKT